MERQSLNSDEIDLLAIAKLLWAKRYTLVASTLGFLIAGILFAQAQTTVYKGKVVVNSLTEAELVGFNAWNQGIVWATSIDPWASIDSLGIPTKNTALSSSKVTTKRLADNFRTYFQRGDALDSALRQHSREIKNFEGNAIQLAALITSLRRNFVLEENDLGEVTITITTSDKSESLQILSTTLAKISQAVKRDSLKSIYSILAATELSRKFELKRLSVEIEAYRRLYEFKKTQSLTLLREQASVARALGLENPLVSGEANRTSAGFINLEQNRLDPFESSYFLQGYNAIEKQIANFENRADDNLALMTANAENLILAKERLTNNDISKVLRPLIDATSFRDSEFRIVKINVDNLDFISQMNKARLAGMVSAIGFLLSIATVLVRYPLQKRDAETGAA